VQDELRNGTAVRARTQRTATATQAGSWSEQLVSTTVGAHTPECCRRGFSQQAGSHGLGGLMQERTLSRSRFCGDNLKALFRAKSSCQVCWRKIEMAMGLSHAFETRNRKRSLPGRQVYEDESERISIMAGVTDSTEGRIHWRRPTAILRFSLATLRLTIHSDYATSSTVIC
jgi:hypothetical protein